MHPLYSTSPPTAFEASRNVSVELDRDNRIVVAVGDECRFGDGCYFGISPDDPDHGAPLQIGLRRLLLQWIQVLSTPEDALLYLPFDFSDEFTRWLACQKIGDQLLVVFGWAPIEGWAFTPSDFSQFVDGVPGFRPDEPLVVQQFYLPRFISLVRHSAACCTDSSRHDADSI